jgi:hypothetical protein
MNTVILKILPSENRDVNEDLQSENKKVNVDFI